MWAVSTLIRRHIRSAIDGKPVDLSYKEFELLTYFVENQGIALSREKILNNVWNYDYFGRCADDRYAREEASE